MPGPIEMRNSAGGSRRLLARDSLVLIGWMALVGAGVAADPPAAQKAVQQTAVDAKREQEAVTQLQRLIKEAQQFEASGKTAEAIADWEKAVAVARPFVGDVSEPMAQLNERLGQLQEKSEAWQAARQVREKVLAIRGKLYGDKDWRVTDARLALQDVEIRSRLTAEQRRELLQAAQANSQAVTLYGTGDFRQAIRLETEAADIRRRVLGENHPSTAESLSNLASLYQSMGEYGKAEPLDLQALEIRKKLLGENHPDTAASLSNLAELYRSMGIYGKAEPLYRQALEMYRKVLGENHPDTAASLSNLAELYRSMGEYGKAEPLDLQALEIRKKLLGEKHPDTALSLNRLAELYRSMGIYAKAEPLFREALAIRKKVLGENHPDTAGSLNNLAALYQVMGEYAKSEPLYRQALEIYRKVLGEKHPHTAGSLNNLALLYQAMGEYAKAEPLHRQALVIYRKVLGENHPDTATSLSSLAALYQAMGEYTKAEPLYRQALEIYRKVLGENHPHTALTLSNMASLYHSMGEYTKAEPYLEQALKNSQRLLIETFGILSEREQLAFEANSRFYLDSYLSVAGTPGSLAAAGAKAASDVDVYRYVLLGKGIVTAQQAFIHLKLRRPELAPLFHELEEDGRRLQQLRFSPPAEPQKREAWRNEVQRLEEERNADQQKLAAQSGEFRQLEESLQTDAGQVKKLQALLPAKTALVDVLEYTHCSPPPHKKGPLICERRLVAFIVHPDAGVKRVDLGPVAPLSTAVERWRQAIINGFGGSDGLPSEHRAGGDSQKPPQQLLRERLFDPLRPDLQGVDLVLISPDGFLTQVPLAALPGREKGRYLLEEFKLAIVPIPRELPALLRSTPGGDASADPSLLLVGGVDFGGAPGLVAMATSDSGPVRLQHRSAVRGPGGFVFNPLPGTEAEISRIAKTFRERFGGRDLQVLTKSEATEEAFRTDAPRHRWIHLATHGFFSPTGVLSVLDTRTQNGPQQPAEAAGSRSQIQGFDPALLSGIAFAGANRGSRPADVPLSSSSKEADDGVLTALEVGELDLRNVDLTVLSACETGLGRVAGGEGVLGLQRAFQTAGVKTCVTSLWKVDDAATQILMTEFYTNLWQKKLGKLEALRQAQLRMLREYDPQQRTFASRGLDISSDQANGPKRGSPFYWAAFVLSGDWR